MNINCRFALDEKRNVIDALNVANSGKAYCHVNAPEDDKYLRDCVLIIRLSGMIEKLIIDLRPRQKLPSGEEYKPYNEESDSILWALLYTIRASYLNTFDPTMSIQHKFDGKLKRQKQGTQDFTSLSLFCDEVECLLRDLYGDFESEALDSIVRAVFRIVEAFAKYVRPDLWKEHQDAEALDYMFGIGVPEGYGINGSDWRRGMAAEADLIHRARAVNANPSMFSEYTVEFVKSFSELWDCSKEYEFSLESRRSGFRGCAVLVWSAPTGV
jgi:hypothetical protein